MATNNYHIIYHFVQQNHVEALELTSLKDVETWFETYKLRLANGSIKIIKIILGATQKIVETEVIVKKYSVEEAD